MHTYRIQVMTTDISHKCKETQKHITFIRKKIKKLHIKHHETPSVRNKELIGGKICVLKQTLSFLIAH